MDTPIATLVDSLPYWDQYPGMEAAVARELARELASTPRATPEDYLRHLPVPSDLAFEGSVFLATEFKRIREGKPPVKFARRGKSTPSDSKDVAGWEAALASAQAELGYQQARAVHLQLLKKYGRDAHVAHNEEAASARALLEREAEELKIEVHQINFNRKRSHEQAGAKLDALEAKYWSTVHAVDAVAAAAEALAKRLKGGEEEEEAP